MKNFFTLKVRYGGSDIHELYYTTENEAEINFLTYFLENYTEQFYMLYEDTPLSYDDIDIQKDKLIEIVNTLDALADVICNESTAPLSMEATFDELYETLISIREFISDVFGWDIYNGELEYVAYPCGYSIHDISDKQVLTVEELVKLVKEKIGLDVFVLPS